MASISLCSLCEPVPRFSHRAVSVGKKIYFHGGYISGPGQGSVVDIFDPYFESWEQQPTTGTTPSKQHEGVCTSVLGSLYSFAGFDGTNGYNTLHKLDTATLEWRELQPQNPANGPMAKSGCGMVAFNCEHLAMFGGYGIPVGPIQREATFTKNFNRNAAGKGWSNELHLFNITEGKWSSPSTTGPRPPPCAYFSLTAINDYQAVMFGGWQPGRGKVNDCYLIDFESMEWTKLERLDERDPWPAKRQDHAACCLNFGEEHPQLLVTGGAGLENKTFSDAWILDVHSRRWKELNLIEREDVQPRMLHTVTAFSLCPGHTQVTKFGGCPMWERKVPPKDQLKMAATTVLEFGEFESLLESLPSGHSNKPSTKEWVLVDVAKSSQLGSDNRVRLRKQQQEFSENVQQQVAAAEIATAHMQERLQEAERQNQDFQTQIKELQQESQEGKRALQLEYDAAKRDLQESQEHIEDLQETIMNSESRVQKLQREIEAVHLQKQTLEESLQCLQAQQTTLEEALQQSHARENQLDQRVQEAEHRAEDAERTARKARAQQGEISTARMRERLQEADRRNQDFQIQIEKLQQESQEEKRALQQECEAAERDLQESQVHIEDLQETILNLEQRVQDADSRVQELQREIEAIHLQKRLMLEGTLQHLQAQQKALEKELHQSHARENRLDQRVQEAEHRAEDAERRARKARAQQGEISTARMRERLQESERQNQDFRIRIKELQRESQKEKRTLQLECDAVEGDLQESQKHIEDLQQTIMNSEQRVQDAESRVQELQREIEAIHLQKQTLEGTLQHLQAQQTTLEADLHQSHARENQLDQRVQEAEHRAVEAERRVREARQRASEGDSSWVVQRDEINLTDVELGRGGWAVVRVAEFRGIRCAAKCLYREIVSNYNRRLFNREMNMAARVRHPNLLQFIGATLDGEPIILTELMPTTVRRELENERTFTQNQINSISLDVAQALNYLHLMRPSPIIHRDISSANVLLEPGPSNTWRAKVSDYGSVNLLEKLRTAAPGNPTYAAPEAQITALQSPKMDIFSFGVLLVEMCSAEFPEVADREELICSNPHPGMVALIRRCLAEDRHARPSANDIIAELRKRSQ